MSVISDAAMAHLIATLDAPDAGERYVVHELIGRGGMGAVYRATDRALERDVALKVLALEGDGSALATQLGTEARVLAQLEHPGIVAVHDSGTLADGRPFYVMRLVRGERLDVHARALTRGDALRLFLGVCDAVAFAHARGVAHRDLTPANVMVGEFGQVLVLDWGLAARLGPDASLAAGTPGFMAPEQRLADTPVDARSDVFGLGAILRSLMDSDAVPRPLAAIVAKATDLEQAHRYESVTALAADVRAFLDQAPVSAYRESPWERLARLYRRHEALVLLLLAYLVMRVAFLAWRGL